MSVQIAKEAQIYEVMYRNNQYTVHISTNHTKGTSWHVVLDDLGRKTEPELEAKVILYTMNALRGEPEPIEEAVAEYPKIHNKEH